MTVVRSRREIVDLGPDAGFETHARHGLAKRKELEKKRKNPKVLQKREKDKKGT